ncbi:MAG: hypothetical protein WDA08_00420 [Weeksellaceae bacterium]
MKTLLIYTITNDELYTFTHNSEIEKIDRESVLMTFLYFDQKIFGEERKYTKIPVDLFESIPEAGIMEGHELQNEEGFGYKEFNFNITEEEGDSTGRIAQICVEYHHCYGCSGTCDNCSMCMTVECWSLGGGGVTSSGGDYDFGGNDPGDQGGGGTGNSNNSPWYTFYPDYYSYHPKLQVILDRLHSHGLHLDVYNEVPYLNSQIKPKFFNQFIIPLNNAPNDQAEFIYSAIIFLCQNKDVVVEPENFMDRLHSLEQYLYENPFAISNIPCNQIPQWQEVAQYPIPQSVKDKLQNLDDAHISPYYGWALQNLENAKGSLVNNDYFAVTFNTMPYKPAPHDSQQFTPEEFLNFVRTNINDFVNTDYSSFSPSNQTGYNEGAIWYSNNPFNSIIHINIPGDDGSVITSGYQVNYNTPPYNDFHNGHWIFTTIKTPYGNLTQGLDGPHPVSGNRKFGLIKNQDGTYTIYTRGVDRVTRGLYAHIFPGQNFMFEKADNLWKSFQDGLKEYIQNNSYGNTVTKNAPVTWRPNWSEVNKVLLGINPQSSLGCQ